VRVRLRSEQGFGLIELLMAMVMLNIGILAIVAAFNSGIVTLNRASKSSTAAALADKIMESYRATTYGCIYENTPPADATYTGDAAYSGTYGLSTGSACVSAPLPASSTQAGADHKNYRADTYVVWTCSAGTPGGTSASPTCPTAGSGRPIKKVTVVVRDPAKLNGRPYMRLASTFDASTG
jgi:Tfp pilus assembly protein PilV